jgi:hypothetical protein
VLWLQVHFPIFTKPPDLFSASAGSEISLLLRSGRRGYFLSGRHFWCQEKHMLIRCHIFLGAPHIRMDPLWAALPSGGKAWLEFKMQF